MEKPTVELVVFKLNEEEYGLPVSKVVEIQKYTEITPVPGVSEYVAGIMNLRGKIIVIIDLKKRFGLTGGVNPSHFIVVDHVANPFALLVDDVVGVVKIPTESVKKSPELLRSKIDSRYIVNVAVTDENRVIIILDPDELVKESDLASVTRKGG